MSTSSNIMYDLVQVVKDQGEIVESRIGPTREILDLSITFTAGMYYTRPNMNQWIGWTEIAQLLAGTFDKRTFESVAPKSSLELFTSNMAYGPRIYSQWEDVIAELTESPDSRRAVMFVGTPNEAIEDLPCTKTIQFIRRNDQLITLVTMRSWDVYKGLPYDIMMFTALAQVTAKILGLEAGHVSIAAGSAHIYESDIDRIDEDEAKWKSMFMDIPAESLSNVRKQMNELDTWLRNSDSYTTRKEALEKAGVEIQEAE